MTQNLLNARNLFFGALFLLATSSAPAQPAGTKSYIEKTPDLLIQSASVTYSREIDSLIFEQKVAGKAAATRPKARGQMDGAPVLGYVFPTTLKSEDVGFSPTEGIVALAITSHPDFDDSPLWDENGDGNFSNDGLVWHTHWVVLVKDTRVAGGLSVKEFTKADGVIVPPTAPPMPMFMDSPGYGVFAQGNSIKAIVPAYRLRNKTDFRYDAVSAYMEVVPHDEGHSAEHSKPMLGVYGVYSVLSKDLSLPYPVTKK